MSRIAHITFQLGIFAVKDTLMSEGLTNAEGEFELSGNDTEWTKIDPKLNIYHNCHDEAIVSCSG